MEKYKNLKVYNLFMGFLHMAQGILMLVLSTSFALPITTSYLKFDTDIKMLVPVLENLTSLELGPVIASFLFLSSLAHFTLVLPAVYTWYIKNLEKGINYARWIEYSFSSSVMIIAISMLTGVYDLSLLISVFFLNMMMILFGMIMEILNQYTKKVNWLPFIFGCIAGAIPWVVISLFLFGSGDGENKAPTFVYVIFFSLFVFFNIFAVNMVLQYKKVGKWKDYLFGEKIYILLSLLAKSALAWQVFFGTLRPV